MSFFVAAVSIHSAAYTEIRVTSQILMCIQNRTSAAEAYSIFQGRHIVRQYIYAAPA